MKKIITLVSAAVSIFTSSAMAADSLNNVENPEQQSLSISTTAKTFYYPQRPAQSGRLDYIFINATNGTQFCREEGYYQATGGSILCGEDESGYLNFDWYQQTWVYKSTGSKNQCYPLYRSITCQ